MNPADPRIRPDTAARCLAFARVAGVTAVAVGTLVTLGWAVDVAPLKSVFPGGATMKPLTAVGFILAGTALLLLAPAAPDRLRFGRLCAALACLLGLLTLAEYLLGANAGFDDLLFRASVRAAGDLHPGRMAPATALGFALLGAGLLLRDLRFLRAAAWADALLLTTALLGLLALFGYCYGVESLYRLAAYSSMALHTAALLLLLGLAALAARPDTGVIAVVLRDDDGGLIARRLLPLAVVLPLFFGWLRLQGQQAGYYELEFGLALFALSNIGLFTLLVWFGARELGRLAAGRRKTAEILREIEMRFSTAFHSSPVGLVLTTPDGRFVEVNPAFCELVGYTREELLGRSSVELGLLGAAQREKLLSALVRAGGSVRNAEVQFRVRNGQLRDVLYSVNPVLLNGVPHRLSTGIDVTDRNRAEAALAAERDRNRVLARRLLEVQETERRQIARDLHDELGQILTALKINLQTRLSATAGTPAPALDLVDRALQQTRALSLSLRPPLLDDLGLAPALRWLASHSARAGGPPIALTTELAEARPAPAIETACFRVAQEALTNALRHAQASRITLEVRTEGVELRLTVRDDGAGFDLAAAQARALRGGSLGLLGMEERVALAGGQIEWCAPPGGGTEVRARFPLSPLPARGEDDPA